VKVIEARGICLHDPTIEPFVVIKLNGDDFTKKSTGYKLGIQWWDKNLCLTVKHLEYDYITVELREKGYHLITSDWIGELQFSVKDFKDGQVHQNWYQLQTASVKKHTRQPRGYIHLAFQLLRSKSERPFARALEIINFEEWDSKRTSIKAPASKTSEVPMVTITEEFTMKPILESEYNISKNSNNILMTEKPSELDIERMEKLNKVNCLHRGSFETCVGKRYMVAIDGSPSSHEAFENTVKMMDPAKDHLFIATVRERIIPLEFYSPRNKTILTHKMWQVAANIITKYQNILDKHVPKIEYSSIMPEADDPREVCCRIVTKYKIDVLVVGKHKKNETKKLSHRVRSFVKYCQINAKCSMVVY